MFTLEAGQVLVAPPLSHLCLAERVCVRLHPMSAQRLLEWHVEPVEVQHAGLTAGELAQQVPVVDHVEDAIEDHVVVVVQSQQDRQSNELLGRCTVIAFLLQHDPPQIVLLYQSHSVLDPRPKQPRNRALARPRVAPNGHDRTAVLVHGLQSAFRCTSVDQPRRLIEHPSLVVRSSLWLKRPDARIRFDVLPDDTGQGTDLRWTLLVEEPEPDTPLLGHLRKRVNLLINANLRFTFGQ
jgi:hypothetical protein